MRGYTDPRRSVAWAITMLMAATGFLSAAIHQNQGPDSLQWFPWIVGGWFVFGGAAVWFTMVISVNAWVWARWEIGWSRRRPVKHRPRNDEPPFRTATDRERDTAARRVERATAGRTEDLTPDRMPAREELEHDFAAGVADAVREVHRNGPIPTAPPVAARVMNERRGGTTGLYAPNPANDPRPQDIRPDRVHPADVNPALTVTQADV